MPSISTKYAGILAMIRTLGALDRCSREGRTLDANLRAAGYAEIAAETRGHRRPRVFFKRWDDPLIGGICWVSELIEIAGGQDVFSFICGA